MNDIEKQYAEIIFSELKGKWVYNEDELKVKVNQVAQEKGVSSIQESKHLYSFMEEMNLIKRVNYPNKVHLYITMESLNFDSFEKAMNFKKLEAKKEQNLIDLEIDRAKWDIWQAKWGWILGILAGIISGLLTSILLAE